MNNKVDEINNLLPQTQCGLCTYDGCKPYAEAIVNQGESIDRCPPGGVRGLKKLAQATQQDPSPFISKMKQTQKPVYLAVIREDECIGCTKCIQACPVDAIVGAAKLMHTVIGDECSGCELCLEPCPVDCIDLVKIAEADELPQAQMQKRAQQFKQRYDARNERLKKWQNDQRKKHKRAKLANLNDQDKTLSAKKAFIQAALERKKGKS